MTKRRTTQATQTIEHRTYTKEEAEVVAHGVMVSFLTKTVARYEEDKARFDERMHNPEYRFALTDTLGWMASDLVQREFQAAYAQRISLDERSQTISGMLEVCADTITELTHRVMSGSFAHRSTSEMHNNIESWQALAAIDFMKYMKLEMRMATLILQDAREVE